MLAQDRENARRRYVRALLDTYARADEPTRAYGARWYGDAYDAAQDLGARYGFTTAQAAGAIAALSPRVGWADNLADADAMLSWAEDARDGLPVADLRTLASGMRAFHANVVTAAAVVCVDDPLAVMNGPKQRAFYRNIMGDTRGVTVDVWATRAATRGQSNGPRNAQEYADISAAYRRAARKVGSTPRDFQAAVWITLRSSVTRTANGNLGGGGWRAAQRRMAL